VCDGVRNRSAYHLGPGENEALETIDFGHAKVEFLFEDFLVDGMGVSGVLTCGGGVLETMKYAKLSSMG
jgi:hypothetical protein